MGTVGGAQHVERPIDRRDVRSGGGVIDGGNDRLHRGSLAAREFRCGCLPGGLPRSRQAEKGGDSDEWGASHVTYLES